MNIQLIEGTFSSRDALEIITQMVQVKIKYHENKINTSDNAEDIKNREAKVKRLQKDMYEIRNYMENGSGQINIQGEIHLSD